MPGSKAKRNSLLKAALQSNALFSGFSGVVLLSGATVVAPWLGLPSGVLPARIVGAGLLAFAAAIVVVARETTRRSGWVPAIIAADFLWVAATAVTLTAVPELLSPAGVWAVVAVGTIVALLAVWQWLGLLLLRGPGGRQSTFSREVLIYRPIEGVWAILKDIGAIAAWNPGVTASHLTSNQTAGVGASRHCDLPGRHYLEEQAVHWSPPNKLTMRITETDLPFAQADIRFDLAPVGQATCVTVSPVYRLRYGALGRVLDLLQVRRQYSRGMEALLEGLKRHAEAARPIRDTAEQGG